MMIGAKANLFSVRVSNGGTTCWLSSVTCIYFSNAKEKMWCKIEWGISCQHVFIRGVQNESRRWETVREQQQAAMLDKPYSLFNALCWWVIVILLTPFLEKYVLVLGCNVSKQCNYYVCNGTQMSWFGSYPSSGVTVRWKFGIARKKNKCIRICLFSFLLNRQWCMCQGQRKSSEVTIFIINIRNISKSSVLHCMNKHFPIFLWYEIENT